MDSFQSTALQRELQKRTISVQCAENMEKSQHTDFDKDTTNESASVACSNVWL